ncbi:MAG: LysR substrate-binding domain-containing protein [Sediminibacterium sp.]|nr:LysR substrate-binding domain-containing protein [Sediminibacterium sp.]
MNLQQLEYIIAVDNERHFVKASEKCFVTQATLSAMIKKLEEELDVLIFDRSKQPVVPTLIGEKIIAQARSVLRESARMKEIIAAEKGKISGEVSLGIIPTAAPYLLPLFVKRFMERYPEVRLQVKELTTAEILLQLQKGVLDMGIMATPVQAEGILCKHLYYEKFKVFASGKEKTLRKKYIKPSDIQPERLLLLEEGHCLREQTLTICQLRQNTLLHSRFDFEAGSIESLVNLAETNEQITIVPELFLQHLSTKRRNQVRSFTKPEPVREMSLVTYRHFVKQTIAECLCREIQKGVKPFLEAGNENNLLPIGVTL